MLDVVAVTYGHTHEVECFISCMRAQTSDRWRLHVVHDGPAPELRKRLERHGMLEPRKIMLHETLRRENCWGHTSRRWALREIVTGKQVLLTNADNYYVPIMVSCVVDRPEDFIWWDVIHNYDTPINHNGSTYGLMRSRLAPAQIDMGAVVVRTRLARQIGFKHAHSTADWTYFAEILATEPTTYKINKVLMVHN